MTTAEQRACMEPLQLAGQIIMESGGETFRVEETITRMGRAFGLEEVSCFAVPSGIVLSFRTSDGLTESAVTRVHPGGTNLSRVDRVNAVSRQVEAGQLSPAEALERLREIRGERERNRWLPLAAAVCAGGFTLMFGGGWLDFILAFLVSGLAQALQSLLSRLHMQSLVAALVGSLAAAILPMLASLLWPELRVETVIAGALMPLLPGLAMTRAVQDTLRGDMLSGASHGLQATLTAGMVAGGTLIAAAVFRMLTGGGTV